MKKSSEIIYFINKDKKGAVAFGEKVKSIKDFYKNVLNSDRWFSFHPECPQDNPYESISAYDIDYYVVVAGGDGTTIAAFRDCWEKGILGHCIFIIVPFVDETKYHKNKGCCIGVISSMGRSEQEALSLLEGEDTFHLKIRSDSIGCFCVDPIDEKPSFYLSDMRNVVEANNSNRLSAFLNEIVFRIDSYIKKCIFEIKINGLLLGEFKAEGILVATKTGSTGWNSSLSQSSPILFHSNINAFVINFIAPEYFMRPMVFPISSLRKGVTIRAKHNYQDDNLIICDGVVERVEKNKELKIKFFEEGFNFFQDENFNNEEYLISKYDGFISKDKSFQEEK